MSKKTTEMTVSELSKAVPGMSDADLAAAYQAEHAAGGDKLRKGAIAALVDEAKARGLTLAGDAQAAPADHAAEIAAIAARLDALEGAAKPEVTRAEVLSLFRKLEALAAHLNFRLPA